MQIGSNVELKNPLIVAFEDVLYFFKWKCNYYLVVIIIYFKFCIASL